MFVQSLRNIAPERIGHCRAKRWRRLMSQERAYPSSLIGQLPPVRTPNREPESRRSGIEHSP
jgi:hypothetical protein